MAIAESGEMYLETILILSKEKAVVRSVDVAGSLGVSKPSVSRAMGLLRDGGFIEMDAHGYLTLTGDGKAVAERIYERHTFLTEYLEKLGVCHDRAVADACKIEHVISEESFAALKNHVRGA